MKELGERLREERERKGLSLKEVATETKISASTIECIEKANLDKLPAPPYLRGFVQTYARHLGLDVDDVMSQFFEFFGSTKPKTLKIEEGAEDNPAITALNEKFPLVKKVFIVVGVVALVVIVFTLQKTIKKYESENINAEKQKSIVSATIEADEYQNAQEAEEEVTPTEAKESESKVGVAQTQEPAKAVIKKEPPAKPAPVAEEKPTPQPAPVAEKKEAPALVAEKEKPAAKKAVAQAKGLELILEALDTLKVTYRIDGNSTKTKEMKPEQVLTLKAAKRINLNATDGGALNVIYNGKDYGVPGNLGQAVELTFPK